MMKKLMLLFTVAAVALATPALADKYDDTI